MNIFVFIIVILIYLSIELIAVQNKKTYKDR